MATLTSTNTSTNAKQQYHITLHVIHWTQYKAKVVGTFNVENIAFQSAFQLQSTIFKTLDEKIFERIMLLDPNQPHHWKLEKLQKLIISFILKTNLNAMEFEVFFSVSHE